MHNAHAKSLICLLKPIVFVAFNFIVPSLAVCANSYPGSSAILYKSTIRINKVSELVRRSTGLKQSLDGLWLWRLTEQKIDGNGEKSMIL